MRLVYSSALAVAVALLVPVAPGAQQMQMDANRKVEGGGISVAGWRGMVDPADKKKGETINNSKFASMGADLHLTVGPASVYWNPANTAMGNYTVKASFHEPKQMNDHAHPYGLFIGGKNLDTATQSYMYCSIYGNGTFIVRGFSGETVVRYSAPRGTKHEAIHTFGADGSVMQEIAFRVTASQVECLANGAVIATFAKADVVAAGKLESTDGIYGIRAGHNTDVMVRGLSMTKN